jgi:hypothetical protein
MKQLTMIEPPRLESVAYGFLNATSQYTQNGTWTTSALQRAFRGAHLWLWGTGYATLTSIWIGKPMKPSDTNEQMLGDLPFSVLDRQLKPTTFLQFVERYRGRSELLTDGPVQLLGERYDRNLHCLNGLAPTLQLRAAGVGDQISFKFHGHVQGVVLLGEQAL